MATLHVRSTWFIFGAALACGDAPKASEGPDALQVTEAATPHVSEPARNHEAAATAPTSSAAPTVPAVTCSPPKLEHFTLSSRSVRCASSGDTLLFDVELPNTGRAVARAQMVFSNSGLDGLPYVWSGNVIVGEPELASAIGADMVPGGNTGYTGLLGAGTLTAKKRRVQVVTRVSALGSPACYDGAITASQATLDVWIEDARPECAGKDLFATSWVKEKGQTASFEWGTSFSDMVALPVKVSSERAHLRILSTVEATPLQNPSVSFVDTSKLVQSRTFVAGKQVDLEQQGTPGVFGGMTHVVLATDAVAQPPQGDQRVQMQAAKTYTSTSVITKAQFGDGILVVIRQP